MSEVSQKVTLTYDRDLVGVVVAPGPSVSAVKWKGDSKVYYILNKHLKEIGKGKNAKGVR